MAPYEEITITLPDGYEAYARYWPAMPSHAAVLIHHGIQSHCGWYERSARFLCNAGFSVLQPDRRGSGRNQRDRGHAASANQLIDDGLCTLDHLRAISGVDRPHLAGISWGGKLAAAMHATRPGRIASLSLITPGLFPIIDVSQAEKFRIGAAMVSNPEKYFDIPLNDPELFTTDVEWQAFLRADDLQVRRATAGFFLASRRMDRIARSLPKVPSVPVHVFLAADERIIDNEQTRHFIRGLDWPHWSVRTYARSRHTLEFDLDGGAFLNDWVDCLRGSNRRT